MKLEWTPSLEELTKAREYAVNVAPTTIAFLKKPTTENRRNIEHKHLIGKIAEEAVYQLYKETIDKTIKPPDYTILIGANKSYAADLTSDKFNYHVKTKPLSKADTYPNIHYYFSKNDPVTLDPKSNDRFILSSIDEITFTVTILKDMYAKYAEFQINKWNGKTLILEKADCND